MVNRGRARRSASLHTVSTLALGLNYFMRSLGPPSFSALANNEDLAVNLDELLYQRSDRRLLLLDDGPRQGSSSVELFETKCRIRKMDLLTDLLRNPRQVCRGSIQLWVF